MDMQKITAHSQWQKWDGLAEDETYASDENTDHYVETAAESIITPLSQPVGQGVWAPEPASAGGPQDVLHKDQQATAEYAPKSGVAALYHAAHTQNSAASRIRNDIQTLMQAMAKQSVNSETQTTAPGRVSDMIHSLRNSRPDQSPSRIYPLAPADQALRLDSEDVYGNIPKATRAKVQFLAGFQGRLSHLMLQYVAAQRSGADSFLLDWELRLQFFFLEADRRYVMTVGDISDNSESPEANEFQKVIKAIEKRKTEVLGKKTLRTEEQRLLSTEWSGQLVYASLLLEQAIGKRLGEDASLTLARKEKLTEIKQANARLSHYNSRGDATEFAAKYLENLRADFAFLKTYDDVQKLLDASQKSIEADWTVLSREANFLPELQQPENEDGNLVAEFAPRYEEVFGAGQVGQLSWLVHQYLGTLRSGDAEMTSALRRFAIFELSHAWQQIYQTTQPELYSVPEEGDRAYGWNLPQYINVDRARRLMEESLDQGRYVEEQLRYSRWCLDFTVAHIDPAFQEAHLSLLSGSFDEYPITDANKADIFLAARSVYQYESEEELRVNLSDQHLEDIQEAVSRYYYPLWAESLAVLVEGTTLEDWTQQLVLRLGEADGLTQGETDFSVALFTRLIRQLQTIVDKALLDDPQREIQTSPADLVRLQDQRDQMVAVLEVLQNEVKKGRWTSVSLLASVSNIRRHETLGNILQLLSKAESETHSQIQWKQELETSAAYQGFICALNEADPEPRIYMTLRRFLERDVSAPEYAQVLDSLLTEESEFAWYGLLSEEILARADELQTEVYEQWAPAEALKFATRLKFAFYWIQVRVQEKQAQPLSDGTMQDMAQNASTGRNFESEIKGVFAENWGIFLKTLELGWPDPDGTPPGTNASQDWLLYDRDYHPSGEYYLKPQEILELLTQDQGEAVSIRAAQITRFFLDYENGYYRYFCPLYSPGDVVSRGSVSLRDNTAFYQISRVLTAMEETVAARLKKTPDLSAAEQTYAHEVIALCRLVRANLERQLASPPVMPYWVFENNGQIETVARHHASPVPVSHNVKDVTALDKVNELIFTAQFSPDRLVVPENQDFAFTDRFFDDVRRLHTAHDVAFAMSDAAPKSVQALKSRFGANEGDVNRLELTLNTIQELNFKRIEDAQEDRSKLSELLSRVANDPTLYVENTDVFKRLLADKDAEKKAKLLGQAEQTYIAMLGQGHSIAGLGKQSTDFNMHILEIVAPQLVMARSTSGEYEPERLAGLKGNALFEVLRILSRLKVEGELLGSDPEFDEWMENWIQKETYYEIAISRYIEAFHENFDALKFKAQEFDRIGSYIGPDLKAHPDQEFTLKSAQKSIAALKARRTELQTRLGSASPGRMIALEDEIRRLNHEIDIRQWEASEMMLGLIDPALQSEAYGQIVADYDLGPEQIEQEGDVYLLEFALKHLPEPPAATIEALSVNLLPEAERRYVYGCILQMQEESDTTLRLARKDRLLRRLDTFYTYELEWLAAQAFPEHQGSEFPSKGIEVLWQTEFSPAEKLWVSGYVAMTLFSAGKSKLGLNVDLYAVDMKIKGYDAGLRELEQLLQGSRPNKRALLLDEYLKHFAEPATENAMMHSLTAAIQSVKNLGSWENSYLCALLQESLFGCGTPSISELLEQRALLRGSAASPEDMRKKAEELLAPLVGQTAVQEELYRYLYRNVKFNYEQLCFDKINLQIGNRWNIARGEEELRSGQVDHYWEWLLAYVNDPQAKSPEELSFEEKMDLVTEMDNALSKDLRYVPNLSTPTLDAASETLLRQFFAVLDARLTGIEEEASENAVLLARLAFLQQALMGESFADDGRERVLHSRYNPNGQYRYLHEYKLDQYFTRENFERLCVASAAVYARGEAASEDALFILKDVKAALADDEAILGEFRQSADAYRSPSALQRILNIYPQLSLQISQYYAVHDPDRQIVSEHRMVQIEKVLHQRLDHLTLSSNPGEQHVIH